MDHVELIKKHGGIRPFARKLGHKHHTKVQGWARRGRIPVDHWERIVDAGAATMNELLDAAVKDARPTDTQAAA